jgi:hypothetical protein
MYNMQKVTIFGTFLFFPQQQDLAWPNLNLHHYVILGQWNRAIDFKTNFEQNIKNVLWRKFHGSELTIQNFFSYFSVSNARYYIPWVVGKKVWKFTAYIQQAKY